jgi:hypothetical protein
MSRKATYRGTCQACGRVQMLPADTLSLHGYTSRWGWWFGKRYLARDVKHALAELKKQIRA